MRQLNTTGYMHSRVRMITACFLIKDLLISWQKGEKYFMNNLIDGDFATNNGSWQWVSADVENSRDRNLVTIWSVLNKRGQLPFLILFSALQPG